MSEEENAVEAELDRDVSPHYLHVRLRVVEAALLLFVLLNIVQVFVVNQNARKMQGQIDDVRQAAAAGLDAP